MARIEVVMPKMGESIAEATVVEWFKKVGDVVAENEELMLLSTDKVDSEVPSPAAGVLVEIVAAAGATVPVETLIAIIETDVAAAQIGRAHV